jgi:hypothetical protein
MGSDGSNPPWAPLAERELSPQVGAEEKSADEAELRAANLGAPGGPPGPLGLTK